MGEVVACRACPRLVAWRESVAATKRAAYRDDDYWGRPVPSFGDEAPAVLVVGLAPAAHGANRTGRMFTGDRSGDFLFASLHRTGFASQPTSVRRGDGLELTGVRITAAVRCAPPDNAPLPEEREACRGFLERELALVAPSLRVVVCLGAIGYQAAAGVLGLRPRPRFGHLVEAVVPPGGPYAGVHVLCSFHPSQQNTFTGRLTPAMLDAVFARAAALSGRSGTGS